MRTKPIRSTNFDANLEWYFAPRAFVSIGAFHGDGHINNGSFTGTYPVLLGNGGRLGAATGQPKFVITGLTNKEASVTA